jgi:hypothetical protein
MLSRTHRIAGVGAAVFLALSLSGGVASAADGPPVGSQACADQVNINADVLAAKAVVQTDLDALNTAQQSGNPSTEAAAQSNLDRDNGLLRLAIRNVTGRICTGAGTTTPTTTVVVPPATTSPRQARSFNAFTDDKDCTDFDSQEAAQAFFLAHRSAAQPDPDRLDANGNGIACEGVSGDVAVHVVANSTTVNEAPRNSTTNTSTTILPTQSDNSVATTSGTQVSTVPEGSVNTGEAW